MRVFTVDTRGLEENNNEDRGAGLDNLYSQETGSLQPQYSVPARRGRRSLPVPPDPDTVTVIVTGTRDSLSDSKIYETLTSVSSSLQPDVPKRPSWTLQLPETGQEEASPLYLIMPSEENQTCGESRKGPSKVENDEVSRSQSGSQSARLSVGGQRRSVTDAGLKLMKRMSLSLGISASLALDQLIQEEEDSDFENDDVFC